MLDFVANDDYVVHGDCSAVLQRLPDDQFHLIYIDPPFNTGKTRSRQTLRTERASQSESDRTGFGGHSYTTTRLSSMAYPDSYDKYMDFLGPKLEEARRLLTDDGTLYIHLDYREAHYTKVFLDGLFGRDAFLNEIVWAYDYGNRKQDRWPQKHDTILVYTKTPGQHFFAHEQITRIPYMSPGMVTAEKRAAGKLPTDVWWHTIVPTNSKEKTGYPTQKPEGILRRIVQASSAENAWVLDFFAGSGTTAAVCRHLGRRFVMVDSNPTAIAVMRDRLGTFRTAYRDQNGHPLHLSEASRLSLPLL